MSDAVIVREAKLTYIYNENKWLWFMADTAGNFWLQTSEHFANPGSATRHRLERRNFRQLCSMIQARAIGEKMFLLEETSQDRFSIDFALDSDGARFYGRWGGFGRLPEGLIVTWNQLTELLELLGAASRQPVVTITPVFGL